MLYMMDVDGTLIRSFISNDPPQCSGCGVKRGVEHLDSCPRFANERLYSIDNYDKVELLPNRLEHIHRLAERDPHACFALVTNQGGVAWGFQTIDQVHTKMAKVCGECNFFFNKPFSVHICFHHPKAPVVEWLADSPRRKPNCGMLDEAMQAHRLVSRATAMFVGDMVTDEQAAAAAGVVYMSAEDFFE